AGDPWYTRRRDEKSPDGGWRVSRPSYREGRSLRTPGLCRRHRAVTRSKSSGCYTTGTMIETEQERKNKRIAAISTAGITVVVLVLLFVIVAWRAPDPPLPEYGIEINFGLDNTGFGAVQPRVSPGEPEAAPEEEVVEETPVESEPVPPVESVPEEQPIVSKVESPVTVKEEQPKKETPPVEEPKKEPEPVREPVKEPVKETPKPPEPKAVYKPNTAKNDAANTRQGDAASHGDDAGKTGDKGNPQGSVDAKALYGKPGGGAGGSSLDLAGWV